MGSFKFIETELKDAFIVEPHVHGDERGFFMETYSYRDFEKSNMPHKFIQDNHSKSRKDVLRGLHFQKSHPQGKLVRVVSGRLYDAIVDLRKDSPTFKKWIGVELSEHNKRMLYVPEGFAHGTLSLTDDVELLYKCTDYYHPEDEGGILWNDPDIGIEWPVQNPILSSKDAGWPLLKDSDFVFDM